MNILLSFIVAFVVFLAIDAAWLFTFAPTFYKKHIGHLMAEKPNLPVAGIFYVIFITGLVYFVLLPATVDQNWVIALTNGAMYGLATYATYDLTNHATLKNWSPTVSVIDISWGVFLSTSVSLVSYFILGLF